MNGSSYENRLTDIQEITAIMRLLEVASKMHGFGQWGAWFCTVIECSRTHPTTFRYDLSVIIDMVKVHKRTLYIAMWCKRKQQPM